MRGRLWFGVATAALIMAGLSPAALAQDADQAGDASTQARLVVGQDVQGAIDPAGDVDWYRLSVEHGQRYSLALVGLPGPGGGTVDPMLGVYDSEGNQLAFNDDANESLNSALAFVPQQTGDVFVEARAFSDLDTGPYRLGVSASAAPPDDVANDTSTRTRANVDRPINGALEYQGDVDVYRLSARTGQRYTITLNAREGAQPLGDPLLRLVDAEGNELAYGDDTEVSLNAALNFVPRANGDVFIEARAYADAYAGDYTLNVTAERLPRDATGADRNTRGRLNIGQSVSAALDFPTDTDWYRVRLTEGQSYRFTLSSAGDDPVGDPLLRLYNASGQEIAYDDDGGDGLNAYLEFTAPSTATYFVEASSFGGEATGGYTLTAHQGDIPSDASTDATLSAEGDYREGMLSPAGDRDWYRVELSEGQALRIAVDNPHSPDAVGDPYVVLYGPDGAEVGRDDDSGEGLNAWLEYQATATGAHFIEVRGYSEDAAGRYAVSITPGEIGSSPDGAEYLNVPSEGRVSVIGAPDDVDWFVIEMIEGRPYRINVRNTGDADGLADPYLTLYDSQGNPVATDDDGGAGLNAYLTFTSVTGGPYFAAVSSYGASGTGRYLITVSDTDVPGHAYTDEALDSSNDSRASRIDFPGDLDNYLVTLQAGVRYVIDVRGEGRQPLADPFLAVLDNEGNRVTSDDDGGPGLDARLRFTPSQPGDYFLQASGLGGSTGDYVISIVRQ